MVTGDCEERHGIAHVSKEGLTTRRLRVYNIQECRDECISYHWCNFWSFDSKKDKKDQNRCFLFKEVSNYIYSGKNLVSGNRDCAVDCGCVSDDTTEDSEGYTCSDGYDIPEYCGKYDTNTFTSKTQCCVCGGGSRGILYGTESC